MQAHTPTQPRFAQILNPREVRKAAGLNQLEFWTRIGVTQSGGSRYESGRNMPKPVRELLRLVYLEKIDLAQIKGEDVQIMAYLRESHPDLYSSLRKGMQHAMPEHVPASLA